MRFASAVEGLVPDGALVRASALRTNPNAPVFAEVAGFLRNLAGGLAPTGRKVLLGWG